MGPFLSAQLPSRVADLPLKPLSAGAGRLQAFSCTRLAIPTNPRHQYFPPTSDLKRSDKFTRLRYPTLENRRLHITLRRLPRQTSKHLCNTLRN